MRILEQLIDLSLVWDSKTGSALLELALDNTNLAIQNLEELLDDDSAGITSDAGAKIQQVIDLLYGESFQPTTGGN